MEARASHSERKTGWSRRNVLFGAGVLAIVLLLLQQFFSLSGKGWDPLMAAVNNAAHVPWFACVTGLVWLLLPSGSRRWQLTLGIACVVAVASESVQYFTVRDAALGDLALNLISAAGTTLVLARGGAWRVLGGTVLLLATLAQPGLVLFKMAERSERWPDLLVANSELGRTLMKPQGQWRWQSPPRDWPDVQGPVLWYEFSWRNWSGVHLHGLDRPWAGYSTLVVDVYVPGDEAIELYLSTVLPEGEHSGRSRRFNLSPGPHVLSVPTDKVAKLDRKVRSLYIYGSTELTGKTLLIGGVTLR